MLQPWWLSWPERLVEELALLDQAGLDFTIDDAEQAAGRIVLRGTVPLSDGSDTLVTVVFPDTFPDTRFTVYATDLALVRHQNPIGRNLCLLPRGSRHWQPQMHVAEVISGSHGVADLVDLVHGGGERLHDEEDPQGEPDSAYLGYASNGAVLVPAEALSIPSEEVGGTFQLLLRGDGDWIAAGVSQANLGLDTPTGQALLARICGRTGFVATAEDALVASFRGAVTLSGRWVRLPAIPVAATAEEVLAAAVAGGLMRATRNDVEAWAVVAPEEVRQGVFEDAWVIGVSIRSAKGRPGGSALFAGQRVSAADLGERIPELRPLRRRTSAHVGLGSLGAPLATEMARALIGGLRLADMDTVGAGTTVRWSRGLQAAGVSKVLDLAKQFTRDYPFTTVEGVLLEFGEAGLTRSHASESERIERLFDGADLIVDATAEDNVSRAITRIANTVGLPQLYLWSVDGIGGVVARCIPGENGCFHCLELALAPDGYIQPPRSADKVPLIQPRGCADRTFTAANPDLQPLVAQAARLAFSTLCRGEPGAYPEVMDDVFVYQGRESDGSLMTPTWHSYPLRVDVRCPFHG